MIRPFREMSSLLFLLCFCLFEYFEYTDASKVWSLPIQAIGIQNHPNNLLGGEADFSRRVVFVAGHPKVNTFFAELLRYFPQERESLQRQVMKTAGDSQGMSGLRLSGWQGQHQMHWAYMGWKCVWCNCITEKTQELGRIAPWRTE